jgi:hypothetical protein
MRRLDPSTALALLRIVTGLLAFPHGLTKVIKGPVAAIGGAMTAHGFPATRFSLDGLRARGAGPVTPRR